MGVCDTVDAMLPQYFPMDGMKEDLDPDCNAITDYDYLLIYLD